MEDISIENRDDTEIYRSNIAFVPIEYAIIDWERSWKKCRCGRIAKFNDNWCGGCGQKLGRPVIDD